MTGNAYQNDRTAVASVCTAIRTTIGPFGTNKFIVEKGGNVSVTTVGAEVLKKLDIEQPVIVLLREAAADFHTRHGDGTSTLLALTGALLQEAESLREQGIHPTTIEDGYRRAAAIVGEHLNHAAQPLTGTGRHSVCRTALSSLRNPVLRRQLAKFLGDIPNKISTERTFNTHDIKIEARTGGACEDSSLVDGLVIDTKPAFEGMPRRVDDAGVALLSSTVDFRRIGSPSERTSDVDVSLSIDSYEDRAALREQELESLRESLQRAAEAGCNFLATSRAVSNRVKTIVAEQGILAIQHVDQDDMERLTRLTGATVIPELAHISPETLGTAHVTVERMAGRDMVFVRGTTETPVWTVFCRAPDPRSLESFERSVNAALQSLAFVERSGTVVPGGGAIEMSAVRLVRSVARETASREQLVMEQFADALTVIPRTLAENAGLDRTTGLMELYAAHAEGRDTTGVDCIEGRITDVLDDSAIVEPPALKRAIVDAAVDTAVKFIRIDEKILAEDLSTSTDSRSSQTSLESASGSSR